MKTELISVVMPTYNREKTIGRAIESIINQTYYNIELIIVDDCSTDKTHEIVEKYRDKRIKYYKLKTNHGACYARNYGIQKSKGEYIAFQDSDDEWDKDKLNFQIKNMKINNSDIDFCEYIKYDGENSVKFPTKKELNRIKRKGYEKALRYGNFISTQLLLVKRYCFDNYKFDENLPRLQDYDLVLSLSSNYKISMTNKILVTVYVQNDSISKSSEKLKKAINIMLHKNYSYKYILYSHLYMLLASNSRNSTEKRHYYFMSLKKHFSIKTMIKFILAYQKKTN